MASLIDEVIWRIERDYKSRVTYADSSKGKDYLKFDSFIITHWDQDHYGGLDKWLSDELAYLHCKDGQSRWIVPRAHYYENWNPKS